MEEDNAVNAVKPTEPEAPPPLRPAVCILHCTLSFHREEFGTFLSSLRVFSLHHDCCCCCCFAVTTVADLKPGTHGHNLRLKVVSTAVVVEKARADASKIRIAEARVGDATGIVTLTTRNRMSCFETLFSSVLLCCCCLVSL